MEKRFTDKVALITGAASGIGRATSLRLAREGAAIACVDLDKSGLAETEEKIAALGGVSFSVHCDVTLEASCRNAIEAVVKRFQRIDVLCNVAGVLQLGKFADMSRHEWDLVLGVNLTGVYQVTKLAIPHLIRARGSIVNVASCAALIGQAYTAGYCASKGGVVSLTQALAMEYWREPIRINAVAPGTTDTPMLYSGRLPDDVEYRLIERYTPPRGFAAPEEIAAAIAFLASGECPSIHGTVLSVDGGVTAG